MLAYIRTGDGFLTAMHDVAPSTEAGHRVVTFNPGKNTAQASRLRLINPGAETAELRITGIDDKGESPGGAVELSVPAGAARTLGAQQLESGEGAGLTGALGTRAGKWQLVVSSEQAIEVMSLLSSPTGHLTNLSTVAARTESAAQVFREHISGPIVQGKCIACHVEGGVSGSTRLVFVRASESDHEARNLQAFKTLRRAALIFAGRIPTDAEYAAAQSGGAALRATIRGLMTGPEFHEFLIRAANDRLLTERERYVLSNDGFLVAYANEFVRRKEVVHATGDDWYFQGWDERVQYGSRRAPLELIAHVVENDRPYTEVLTADYIMANPMAAAAYGASTRFDDLEDLHEFKPSRIASYYRHTDGYEAEDDPVIDAYRVIDPGPLRTDYPQAGILNTKVFPQRYPTTATNRNRARSRWTYYHFLGFDIEKSASRTTDPEALADTNNPTMHNPACTVCHRVLDPVAGAFQNYDDAGWYKSNWHGVDSLDEYYKRGGYLAPLAIQADSWEDRETLSWSVPLAAGANTLRVFYTNDFYNKDTSVDGTIYLDRLDVRDARGLVLVSREFEHLDSPYIEGGGCGGARHHSNSGPDDHVAIWNGYLDCPILVDVDVESAGKYSIEVVAWADRHEQYGEDGFAEMSVALVNEAHICQEGDTWYRDMRVLGFGGEVASNSDNSVQWLAQQIVADERFAEATVKFWWPAIMGSEVAEPPEEEEDADFEGRLLAANAQGAEVARLARGFRHDSRGGLEYNLKDLLVEMVLSEWFRAEALEDEDPVRRVALRDAGARRLLTPEELARKTAALTGFQWGRRINADCEPDCDRLTSSLTDQFRLIYGGIDSDGITERARDITSVMAGVAKLHAAWASCPIIVRELYLLPESKRRLFAGIDRSVTPPEGANAIRDKLVELHDKLLGVQVTPHSPDVESAYRLFLEEVERARTSGHDPFYWVHQNWSCFRGWVNDHLYFDGILDDVVVEQEHEDGVPYYDFDHDRVEDFMESVDLSDPHHTAHAWVMVLAYLLADYRFLYL